MTGYCSVAEVKYIADIPSDVTDAQLLNIIDIASMQVNHDINTYIFKEYVTYIDDYMTNEIDGTNTTFYVKNLPLGDYNDDCSVTTADITVYKEYTDGNGDRQQTTATVSSIDSTTGKFVLSTAPDTDEEYFVTYCFTPKHYPVTSTLVKYATAYLAAFMAKSKVGEGTVSRYTLDRLTVVNLPEQVKHDFYRYIDLIDRIKSDLLEVGELDVE